MSENIITIQLPKHIYERLQTMAQIDNRPIENIALNWLSVGLDDDVPDQTVFDQLTDEQLRAILDEPFHVIKQIRLDELHDLRDVRPLTADEEYEVDQLLESYDRYVLRRSKAMLALHRHGVDVKAELEKRE
ncbi:MAG: hypothetical protein MUE54_15705 [Anaerolineae bacterium]|jgi:hypothetical protein|nr:hypothetical protein [Anaerolineae bacterium]